MKKFNGKFTRFFSLVLAVIMIFSFSIITVSAEDAEGEYGNIKWFYTAADKTITVFANTGNSVEYDTAQSQWNDLDYERVVIKNGIVNLISNCLTFCKAKVIILPDSLRVIEKGAFKYSPNLKWLHIPEGVTTIGDSIVQGCSALKSIYLPKTLVAANVSDTWCYDDKSGNGKIALTKLYMFPEVLNESYNEVKNKTYAKYTSNFDRVKAVNMKADGTVAYSSYNSTNDATTTANFNTLLTSAVAGDTITILSKITSTGLPEYAEGVKIICNAVLGKTATVSGVRWTYSALDKTITIKSVDVTEVPTDLPTTGSWSTLDYNKIVVAEGITKLVKQSLMGNKAEVIVLPHTLKTVGAESLRSSTKVKSIHFPEGVTYLGSGCIWGCKSLKSVYLPSTLLAEKVNNTWWYSKGEDGDLKALETLYIFNGIENADSDLKTKTYNKYYGKATIIKVTAIKGKSDGTYDYGTLTSLAANAEDGDVIDMVSNTSVDLFVDKRVTFNPGSFTYRNIFYADTNGDNTINVLDYVRLKRKSLGVADDITTGGVDFKIDYAESNMRSLKSYLLK